MKFIKIIILLTAITPFMFILSGCSGDAFLDAMKEEEDFIAPFDVVIQDSDSWRTSYSNLSDTGRSEIVLNGDDASFVDIPAAVSFTERNVANGGSAGDDTDTDDIVDDNVTGLTWIKCTIPGRNLIDTNDDCSAINAKLSWSHANETCSNLIYGGYDDWRVPTVTELFSILNFNNWPLINIATSLFSDNENSPHNGYWTSTSKLFVEFNANYESFDVNDYAWIIFFGGGGVWGVNIVDIKEKLVHDEDTGITTIEMQYTRCVRGVR